MTYNEYLQLMLDAALDIKAGNFDEDVGICSNLSDKVNSQIEESEERYESHQILEQAFCTWPKFSGDANFPINDPYNRDPAYRAYNYLPKWIGEYGALRFELLDHIIDCLKREIESATRTA
jgi:hypothetical protein